MRKGRKRKVWPICGGIVVRGRLFTQKDLVNLRGLIRAHPKWGRTKLSVEACDLLEWNQPNGRAKDRACRVAMLRLEELGLLRLPKKIINNGGRPPATDSLSATLVLPEMTAMPNVVECRLVQSQTDSRLWNSLIASYHYLGLSTPVGRLVRYLVFGDGEVVSAISFTECAWSVSARDFILRTVGWDFATIRSHVIGNNRFLILPTIRVPNLASRILAESLRKVNLDWPRLFGASPAVVETFVDPRRFEGTCYRAANWFLVGTTKGFSKQGNRHVRDDIPKLVFLRGMDKATNAQLQKATVGYKQNAA